MKFPRPPSRRAPTPGEPPPAKRLPVVGGDRPPPPGRARGRGADVEEAQEAGRVFAFFGPRGAGTSTLLRVLHEESETKTALFTLGAHALADALADQVETVRDAGTEVIMLDGAPRDVDSVQWLYDERMVAPAWGGGIIRVDRNAVVDREFVLGLPAIERLIRDLSMPYFVVHSDNLERAAVDIATRMGLWR